MLVSRHRSLVLAGLLVMCAAVPLASAQAQESPPDSVTASKTATVQPAQPVAAYTVSAPVDHSSFLKRLGLKVATVAIAGTAKTLDVVTRSATATTNANDASSCGDSPALGSRCERYVSAEVAKLVRPTLDSLHAVTVVTAAPPNRIAPQ